jgi:hypothetical protein
MVEAKCVTSNMSSLGVSTFTYLLPPIGTQVRRVCLVLVWGLWVQGFRLMVEAMNCAGTFSIGLGSSTFTDTTTSWHPGKTPLPGSGFGVQGFRLMVEAMNYAGPSSNGPGWQGFTDILPPVGTQEGTCTM